MKLIDFFSNPDLSIKFNINANNKLLSCTSHPHGSNQKRCGAVIYMPFKDARFACITCNCVYDFAPYLYHFELVPLLSITI